MGTASRPDRSCCSARGPPTGGRTCGRSRSASTRAASNPDAEAGRAAVRLLPVRRRPSRLHRVALRDDRGGRRPSPRCCRRYEVTVGVAGTIPLRTDITLRPAHPVRCRVSPRPTTACRPHRRTAPIMVVHHGSAYGCSDSSTGEVGGGPVRPRRSPATRRAGPPAGGPRIRGARSTASSRTCGAASRRPAPSPRCRPTSPTCAGSSSPTARCAHRPDCSSPPRRVRRSGPTTTPSTPGVSSDSSGSARSAAAASPADARARLEAALGPVAGPGVRRVRRRAVGGDARPSASRRSAGSRRESLVALTLRWAGRRADRARPSRWPRRWSPSTPCGRRAGGCSPWRCGAETDRPRPSPPCAGPARCSRPNWASTSRRHCPNWSGTSSSSVPRRSRPSLRLAAGPGPPAPPPPGRRVGAAGRAEVFVGREAELAGLLAAADEAGADGGRGWSWSTASPASASRACWPGSGSGWRRGVGWSAAAGARTTRARRRRTPGRRRCAASTPRHLDTRRSPTDGGGARDGRRRRARFRLHRRITTWLPARPARQPLAIAPRRPAPRRRRDAGAAAAHRRPRRRGAASSLVAAFRADDAGDGSARRAGRAGHPLPGPAVAGGLEPSEVDRARGRVPRVARRRGDGGRDRRTHRRQPVLRQGNRPAARQRGRRWSRLSEVPAGVRDVIRRRLARLPDATVVGPAAWPPSPAWSSMSTLIVDAAGAGRGAGASTRSRPV